MARPRFLSKAPIAVAGVISAPLFFCALMAASLAVERPEEIGVVHRKGKLVFFFDEPTTWTEAKIWLLALSVIAIVIVVGLVAMFVPRGVILVGATGIVVAFATTWRLDTWKLHHIARFPYGEDLIRDPNTSNLLLRGEWEKSAVLTAEQLRWVTVGLAGAAIVVSLLLELRRRRARPAPDAGERLLDEQVEAQISAGASGQTRL